MSLASWFIESKVALESAQATCSNAESLITQLQDKFRTVSGVLARSLFVYNSLNEQCKLLDAFLNLLKATQSNSSDTLKSLLIDLDQAYEYLEEALSVLHATKLVPSLELPSKKLLDDFVSDNGIEHVRTQLDHYIAGIQTELDLYTDDVNYFEKELAEFKLQYSSIAKNAEFSGLLRSAPVKVNDTLAVSNEAIASMDQMNANSEVLAELLESLAKHYDQCSEAVEPNAGHLSLQEREELEAVVREDAYHVDTVLSDISAQYKDIVSKGDDIQVYENRVNKLEQLVSNCVDSITKLQEGKLAHFIDRVGSFKNNFSQSISAIETLLNELVALRDHYTRFAIGYDSMILEIKRRQEFDDSITQLFDQFMSVLKTKLDAESTLRQNFLSTHGEFLPSDLWPGLIDPPKQFEIISQTPSTLPEISEEDTANATARLAYNNK
ncbi:hypothetical protein CANCADRAFT_58650 [Tortispora caseinolytica NRRL Y-17796]|uniref:Autophagy-related protein 17 n=1 Tax=Tortispora caseinolytica NRRL Y-17796 TaxID=767744 RepID=A0A1E4TDG9_9ASCO|nr:hypothetical protein CANCADRAFT_58650 [Tortispora caseinolytica NRRL Y-17796]